MEEDAAVSVDMLKNDISMKKALAVIQILLKKHNFYKLK